MPTSLDLRFPPFTLDVANEQLRRDDQVVPIRPKAFAFLKFLAEQAGRLVRKDEILAEVWKDTVVADTSLKVIVGELRDALDDDPAAPRFIETVARRGYRFIAPVSRSLATTPTDATPRAEHVPPPIVIGRASEIAALDAALTKALRGTRQVVYVTGDAGTGKTTLVNAFVARATQRHELWVGEGRCVEHYGSGEAYLPILEAVSRLCRGAGRDHLPALLRRYAPTWLLQLPWLLAPGERETLQRELQGVAQERMLREMADTLEALTAEVPFVFTLEDLHWSDYSTLDLLSLLTRRPGTARLLVIATYRPVDAIVADHPVKHLKQDLTLRGLCDEIALESFTAAEVAAFLERRFPPTTPPPSVVTLAHRGTDGHPLFLAAVAEDLARQGMVAPDGDGWRWVSDARASLGVPPTIRQLIERQSEHLDGADRRLLEVGSALGATFTGAAAAAALDEDVTHVEERAEALVRQGPFLRALGVGDWPDGTPTAQYGFTHALHQRVLHDSIPAGRRSRLHAQLGERLEAAYGSRAGEIAAELAGHFEEGHDYARAVRYRQQAAANAGTRAATREAVDHLLRAEALLPHLPEDAARLQTELAIQMGLGPALMSTRGYAMPEVERAFTRARTLCHAMGDPAPLFPVLWGIWGFHVVRGEMGPARALAEQCLALAEQTGDPDFLVEAHHGLWVTRFFCGELASALDHVTRGLALYRPEHRGHVFVYGQDPAVAAHSYGALIAWYMGDSDASDRHAAQALALGREVAHPFSLGFALNFVTWVQYCRGDTAATCDYAEQLIALATEQGFPFWLAGATHFAAWAMVADGDVAAGVARMRAAQDAWRATGAGLGLPSHLGRLAESYLIAGDMEAATTTLAEAFADVERNGQRYYEPELLRLRGEIALGARGKGAMREADDAFTRALELAIAGKSRWLALRSATSLARLRVREKRGTEAAALLAPFTAAIARDPQLPDATAAGAALAATSKS
jgi:DNA-binding winged helix-turn-helix (wHTH) protein/predicted ATPase